jgi:hypothetical protein
MTTRTVVWIESAESELATIWLAAGRSEAVTKASYKIDRDLRMDAERNGRRAFCDRAASLASGLRDQG